MFYHIFVRIFGGILETHAREEISEIFHGKVNSQRVLKIIIFEKSLSIIFDREVYKICNLISRKVRGISNNSSNRIRMILLFHPDCTSSWDFENGNDRLATIVDIIYVIKSWTFVRCLLEILIRKNLLKIGSSWKTKNCVQYSDNNSISKWIYFISKGITDYRIREIRFNGIKVEIIWKNRNDKNSHGNILHPKQTHILQGITKSANLINIW